MTQTKVMSAGTSHQPKVIVMVLLTAARRKFIQFNWSEVVTVCRESKRLARRRVWINLAFLPELRFLVKVFLGNPAKDKSVIKMEKANKTISVALLFGIEISNGTEVIGAGPHRPSFRLYVPSYTRFIANVKLKSVFNFAADDPLGANLSDERGKVAVAGSDRIAEPAKIISFRFRGGDDLRCDFDFLDSH